MTASTALNPTNLDPIVILSAKRTPIANYLGEFATLTAPQLGSAAIAAAVKDSQVDPALFQEVIMGCVLSAGIGQAPARQAALGAGLPESVGALTINKMCSSGMKAVMLSHDLLKAGTAEFMVAGGMESMTQAPYLIPKGRQGYRLGHGTLYDHMMLDGLEDAYERGRAMGYFAELTAQQYGFSREIQDEFATNSLLKAQRAAKKGYFSKEITPVTVTTKKQILNISEDEGPRTLDPAKIPLLKPAFTTDGTVTAANSSSISDGATALVLTRESIAKTHGLKPLAKILGFSTHAQASAQFTTAPIPAIQKLLKNLHWSLNDVDLFEINEAFAIVTLAAIHDLDLDPKRVNIHGGACALGHPIGASGARILVTLVYALQQTNKTRGIAALCLGGGEATAIAIELM